MGSPFEGEAKKKKYDSVTLTKLKQKCYVSLTASSSSSSANVFIANVGAVNPFGSGIVQI